MIRIIVIMIINIFLIIVIIIIMVWIIVWIIVVIAHELYSVHCNVARPWGSLNPGVGPKPPFAVI